MNSEETQQLGAEQALLQDDFERLEHAAVDLPSTWTGIRWDGASIVVLTTDPDRDCAGLLARVDHPERVRFQRARYSRQDLDWTYRAVLELLGEPSPSSSWHSHGPGLETVTVHLRSTEAALAQQLHDRFGDALEITLGQHRFPLDQQPPAPAQRQRAVPAALDLPHLTLIVEPDAASYPPGAVIHGQVRIHNTGTHRVILNVGRSIGSLTDQNGRTVGGFTGAIAGVEHRLSIGPGLTNTTGFIAGSDTTDPTHGTVLAPGSYLLTVTLHVTVGQELGPHGTLTAGPVPLQLSPAIAH